MFMLQHGAWECVLNTVEACAIHAWPAVVRFKLFICLIKPSKCDKT